MTTMQPSTREYNISAQGINLTTTLNRARAHATTINNKGLQGHIDIHTEERTTTNPKTGHTTLTTWLIINHTPAAYNGWQFVALIEWANGNPIITGSPSYNGATIDRDTLNQDACDHCNTNRQRSKQVLVENTTTGERKTVGTTCLKDFLGHEFSPSFFNNPFEHEYEGYSGEGETLYPAQALLAVTNRIIRSLGYTPRYYEGATSTVSNLHTYYGAKDKAHKALLDQLKDADDIDNEFAEKTLEFINTLKGDSDWALNLKAVTSANEEGHILIRSKHFGLLVSALGAYHKQVAKDLEEATATPVVEEFVGAIGDKIEIKATMVTARELDSDWGTSTAYTFIAENGHRFEWITNTINIEDGAEGVLRGTIKKHREYVDRSDKTRKTTSLTRCKWNVAS